MRITSSRAVSADHPPRVAAGALRRPDWLLLAGVAVIACLARLPGLALPLERDEGAYAFVAWNWLNGGLPYRDAFDHKPPLIYLLYMPALLFGAPTAMAIRIWGTVLFLISLSLVYSIGRRVWGTTAALLATLIFGVAGSAFDLQGLILNTEQALVLPALLSLWYTIRLAETQRRRYASGAGAAFAATVLIKPVAIVLVPCLVFASRRRMSDFVRNYGFVALGAALVGGPIAGYFALRGGWNDLVFGVVTYNRVYAAESQERWRLGGLVDMFAPFVPLLLTALGGAAYGLSRGAGRGTHSKQQVILVSAWAVALLLAALGSLRAFVHYYYPILPFLALLAAPCVTWLWSSVTGATLLQRAIGRIAPLLLLALLLGPFALQNARLIGTTAEAQAERLYGDVGKFYFAQAQNVADFVRERTQPDDPIYIFAAEPEVYLLAERRSVSRYIYDYPFQFFPQARAELLRDLAAKPPALVITYYGVRPDGFFETVRTQNFVKLAEIGGYEVYGPQE